MGVFCHWAVCALFAHVGRLMTMGSRLGAGGRPARGGSAPPDPPEPGAAGAAQPDAAFQRVCMCGHVREVHAPEPPDEPGEGEGECRSRVVKCPCWAFLPAPPTARWRWMRSWGGLLSSVTVLETIAGRMPPRCFCGAQLFAVAFDADNEALDLRCQGKWHQAGFGPIRHTFKREV